MTSMTFLSSVRVPPMAVFAIERDRVSSRVMARDESSPRVGGDTLRFRMRSDLVWCSWSTIGSALTSWAV